MDRVHTSRQARIKGSKPDGSSKQKSRAAAALDRAKEGPRKTIPINPLKSKIRDLTRLLENSESLPVNVRVEKERALDGYKQDLKTVLAERHRNKMISKYHMVRFFERQKATRNLKKIQTAIRKLGAAGSESETQRAALNDAEHMAQIDLNYTLYHPLNEKYLSLFPKYDEPCSGDANGAKSTQSKPAMWNIVASCTQEGNLMALRDGKLTSRYTATVPHQSSNGSKGAKSFSGSAITKATKIHASKSNMEGGEDEESDGGFFET